MKKTQALNVLVQAVSQYKGTLQEHRTIQQALEIITKVINAKTETKEEKVEPKEAKKTNAQKE